jgi:hypothetical protein
MTETQDLSLLFGRLLAALYKDPMVSDDTKLAIRDVGEDLMAMMERIDKERDLILNVVNG